ncbi:hypothetical protein E1A91_A05G319300v1 [Gossypium mustelinum]|uniref:Uncharacterized protein n=2 Tax=Gossypium TaxID=3633 RepID=A0A5D2ZEL6_GOSMU|nr:hypothetical protein ES288_A05G326100v1 [Gossypium darwinii]TYJ36619.1 hypothetical protein E1A91_A05G319300v1 [Gossypium mustelinum]
MFFKKKASFSLSLTLFLCNRPPLPRCCRRVVRRTVAGDRQRCSLGRGFDLSVEAEAVARQVALGAAA